MSQPKHPDPEQIAAYPVKWIDWRGPAGEKLSPGQLRLISRIRFFCQKKSGKYFECRTKAAEYLKMSRRQICTNMKLIENLQIIGRAYQPAMGRKRKPQFVLVHPGQPGHAQLSSSSRAQGER